MSPAFEFQLSFIGVALLYFISLLNLMLPKKAYPFEGKSANWRIWGDDMFYNTLIVC